MSFIEIFKNEKEKKGFLKIFLGAVFLLVLVLFLFWALVFYGIQNIPFVSFFVTALFLAIGTLTFLSVFSFLSTVYTGKSNCLSKKNRGILLKVYLPIMIFLGKFIARTRREIWRSFLSINNFLIEKELGKIPSKDCLLILPHCLQKSTCPLRLVQNVYACKGCGECCLKDIIAISKELSMPLILATGGTAARKAVKEHKPKLIFAVACERDLASGVQDSYPYPVYAILNERPFGDCLDTHVQIGNIQKALSLFVKEYKFL